MPDIFVAKKDKKKPRLVWSKREKFRRLWRKPQEYSTVMAKERATTNPLAAFVVRPKKVRFETQEKKEYVLLLLRRHVVTNFPWIMIVLVAVLVPVIVQFAVFWEMVPGRYKFVGMVALYLLVLGYAIESFLTWYFNVFIVTDERIIDIDFYSLLYKKFSSAKIEQIQDVTFTQGGVLAALFNYGTIFIQTAGERREFDLDAVPHPRKVVLFLNEMLTEEEREKIEGRVR